MTLLPALVYALFAIPMGHDAFRAALDTPLFSMVLPSGSDWVVNRGDALKATGTSTGVLVENSLSVVCFTLSLVAFLLVPAFGTNEFFLIAGMILVDFMASFIVMTVSARRDVSFSN